MARKRPAKLYSGKRSVAAQKKRNPHSSSWWGISAVGSSSHLRIVASAKENYPRMGCSFPRNTLQYRWCAPSVCLGVINSMGYGKTLSFVSKIYSTFIILAGSKEMDAAYNLKSPWVLLLWFLDNRFFLLLLSSEKIGEESAPPAADVRIVGRSTWALHVWQILGAFDTSWVNWEQVFASGLLPVTETTGFECCDTANSKILSLILVLFGILHLLPLCLGHATTGRIR